jgi:Zn-finger nucleic acid-binding protein
MADGVCPECGTRIALTVPPCPRCAMTDKETFSLVRLPADRIGSWQCARCTGVGFERDRLRAVASRITPLAANAKHAAIFDLVAQSPVACTRCRGAMSSIVIDKRTVIDRCTSCGLIWLDPGELGALAAYLKRHLGGARPPRQIEEMLGDPSRIVQAVDRGTIRTGEWDGWDTWCAAEIVVALISWLFS